MQKSNTEMHKNAQKTLCKNIILVSEFCSKLGRDWSRSVILNNGN